MHLQKTVLALLILSLGSAWAGVKKVTPKKYTQDQKEAAKIALMIRKVEPTVDEARALKLGHAIHMQSQKHKLDPKIMIAIIDTESDFRQSTESVTGDISLAQINPQVWVREFVRLKKNGLDIERLKADEAYAIDRMAEILRLIKDRHAKTDSHWYARYHSGTKKYKMAYKAKVKRKVASILAPVKMKTSKKWPGKFIALKNRNEK